MNTKSDKEIWVFLSHSNEDYEKVRRVRNMLEDDGLRPIMFFLKCLNDDDEIDDLIKREIDCRTRFILCDSINAKNSKWVQREVDYIKSKNQIFETVDLSEEDEAIMKKLHSFRQRFNVYLLYSEAEISFVKLLANHLQALDFFTDNCRNIDNALTHGHLIVVYSSKLREELSSLEMKTLKDAQHKYKDLLSIFTLDKESYSSALQQGLKIHPLNGTNPQEAVNAIFSSIQFAELSDAFNMALSEHNPEAMYWYGLRLYNDDRGDYIANPEITCRNIECASYFLLRGAAEQGHKSAKDLLRTAIWCYIQPNEIERQIALGVKRPQEIKW